MRNPIRLPFVAAALAAFCYSAIAQSPKETLQRAPGTNTVTGTSLGAPFKVETVAALKAVVATQRFNGQQVEVSGYYTSGDGGGGMFQFNSASSATDNGGTVLAPTTGTGRWLRVYNAPLNVKWFGAKGDGSTNDTAAIQATISAGTASGVQVFLPAATYSVTPATSGTSEAGAIVYAFSFTSNLDIRGDIGATLRVANGVSSSGAPVRMAMFFTSGIVSNIRMSGLMLDMNGSNNAINPGGGPYDNSRAQAHIYVSGTTAKASNVLLENCTFQNSPGTNSVVMGQSNTAAVSISTGWRVINCRFLNNGLNTSDVSAVYGWANDVVIEKCEFQNDSPPATGSGLKTAYEVHGYDQRFAFNRVINAYRGIYLASNLTAQCNRIIITNNVFEVMAYGIEFYRETSAEYVIADVTIANNQFAILDTAVTGIQKAAVTISTIYGVSDILIANNNASKSGSVDSAFVVIETRDNASSEKKNKITVEGNTAYGFVQGVAIYCRRAIGLGKMAVKNNTFFDIVTGVSTTITAGSIDSLEIVGNRFNSADYGIDLGGGTISLLHVQGNSYADIATADYTESATITARTGDYDNLTYTPTLTGITLGNGTVTGSYSLRGSQVTVKVAFTVGSSTTFSPGTSWSFSLPGTAAAISGSNYVGNWILYDASATTFYCGAVLLQGTATTFNFVVNGVSGFMNNATPITPATGDSLSAEITYNQL